MAYSLAQNPVVVTGGGSNTINKAFSSSTTAHSVLLAFLTTDAAAPGTVSFTGGGTWQQVNAKLEPNSTQWVIIGCCLDATGGSAPTVTATWTGNGGFNGLMIAEFTNGGNASLLDTNTAGSTGSSTTPTDSAMTASAVGLAVSWAIAVSGTYTAGTGFTIGGTDTSDVAAWEYDIDAGPGSVTPSFTLNGSAGWGIVSALFKTAAAVGTVAVPAGGTFPPWVPPWRDPGVVPLQLQGDRAQVTAVALDDTAAGNDALTVFSVDDYQAPEQISPAWWALRVKPEPLQLMGDASGPVSVSLADTAAGDDVLTSAAAVPLADTAAGADALTVAAAIPLADTGSGTDALTVTVAVSLDDVGTGADQLTVLAGTDPNQYLPGRAPMFYDLGRATQVLGDRSGPITANVSLTDTGTGDDSATVSAAVPLSDTAAGDDSLSVAVAVPLSDTATGDDSLSAQVVGAPDTYQFVRGLAPMFYDLGRATQLTGSSELATTTNISLSDTATGDDSLSVSVAAQVDTNQAGPQIAWMFTEPNAASFQLRGDATASGDQVISLSDTATAADALTAAAATPLADTATAADALSVVITDAAYTIPIQFPPFGPPFKYPHAAPLQLLGDTGGPVAVTLSDTATASDTLSSAAAVALTDTAAAADLLAITVGVAFSETATAVDILASTAALILSETVTAADLLDVYVQLPFRTLPSRISTLERRYRAGTGDSRYRGSTGSRRYRASTS